MKNTNKNKYNIILALCSMLSYGVYGAASSSDSPIPDLGPASENIIRLECFTLDTLYGLPVAKNPENSEEMKVSSISGDNIEYIYNKEADNWKVTNDGKEFTLSIGDNLCFHSDENAVNMYVVKLFIDPNDPMKCIFHKLGNFRDTRYFRDTEFLDESLETEQEEYDRMRMYLLLREKFVPTKIDYDTLKEFYIYPNGDMRRYFAQFCAESNADLINYCMNKTKIALSLISDFSIPPGKIVFSD